MSAAAPSQTSAAGRVGSEQGDRSQPENGHRLRSHAGTLIEPHGAGQVLRLHVQARPVESGRLHRRKRRRVNPSTIRVRAWSSRSAPMEGSTTRAMPVSLNGGFAITIPATTGRPSTLHEHRVGPRVDAREGREVTQHVRSQIRRLLVGELELALGQIVQLLDVGVGNRPQRAPSKACSADRDARSSARIAADGTGAETCRRGTHESTWPRGPRRGRPRDARSARPRARARAGRSGPLDQHGGRSTRPRTLAVVV